MKQTEFVRIENEVVKTVEPILREKVLEQVRRKEVRIVTLLCCVLGPDKAYKTIAQAALAGGRAVGPTIRRGLPSDSELSKILSEISREVVDEELTRRVFDSIVEKLEGGAASIVYMELVRVIYWGCLAMFVVSHIVHWALGMWL